MPTLIKGDRVLVSVRKPPGHSFVQVHAVVVGIMTGRDTFVTVRFVDDAKPQFAGRTESYLETYVQRVK